MNRKRLTALIMSFVLICSMSVALAAEQLPAFNRSMDVLKSGRSVESTSTLNVNAETLGSLAAMMNGESSPEAAGQLTTVLSALNKLVFKSLVSMDEAGRQTSNMTVGTDKGDLVDLKISADTTTGENAIATNVLPGIVLKMDQAQLAAAMQQSMQLQQHPETLQLVIDKYTKVMDDAFNAEVLPVLQTEAGAFTKDEGEFDTHMQGDVTAVTMSKYIKAVLAVAKEDTELQQLLDPIIENAAKTAQQSATDGDQSASLPFSSAAEALDKLDKKLDAVIEKGGDETIMHLDAYINQASKQMLVDIDTPVSDGQAVMLSLLSTPQQNGVNAKVTMLMKPVTDEAEAAAPIDWAKVKADVQNGEDPSVTVINMELSSNKDEAANKRTGVFSLNANFMGTPVGITLTGEETLTGAYESTFKIGLTFMMPDPLLEITTHSVESDLKPEIVGTEGAQVFEIKENATDEEMAPLMQALQEKGVPMLMENLSKALPDEAGLIMQMLSPAEGETGTTQAN